MPLCQRLSQGIWVCLCVRHGQQLPARSRGAVRERGRAVVSGAAVASPKHGRILREQRSAKQKQLEHIWLPSEGLQNILRRRRERKERVKLLLGRS